MSDFSELCPLFHTGVFHEVMFPDIRMTDISVTGRANALFGTGAGTKKAAFTFGRTVIVTGAYLRRNTSQLISNVIELKHFTSETVSGTAFGTLDVPTAGDTWCEPKGFVAMNVTAQTFASSDVLGLGQAINDPQSAMILDLIVRYKEK